MRGRRCFVFSAVIYLWLFFIFSGNSQYSIHWNRSNKEMLRWGANIKCFQVPLFRKYFNLSSSLLDNVPDRFVFNGKFVVTSVQSTCKMPYNSKSRVHRRLKKTSNRKQNSKNVHAKTTDNCLKHFVL